MPGLLSGTASLGRSGVKLRVACRAGGKATFGVPSFGSASLASARYKCAGGRGTASFALSASIVARINRSGSVLGRVSFTQGGALTRASVMVGPRPPAAVFWTSVFGLQCGAPGGFQAVLQAPNFTVTPPTTIDVRPWLAWYTPATGWQWQGTVGPGASRWYRFTATPTGVAEWRTPLGTVEPWLWSPIAVARGRGVYMTAVFEAVYWYTHPAYVWRFAHSVPGTGPLGGFCAYG
jgi:ribosomal protein L37E